VSTAALENCGGETPGRWGVDVGKMWVFIHIVQHLIIAYSSTFNGEL